ncbi:MAG: hypothetical protein NDI62_01410 [Burkholderiales bacterium]|nr:hypothetical protein [Burkholderiales bacterium]
MKKQILKNNKGFVMLFAVMISSMILAIALGVADVALKEINFTTSAKEANNAFFAADAGAECALFYDKSLPADNAFTGTAVMNCSESLITVTPVGSPASKWTFVVPGLGYGEEGCAKVTVDKTGTCGSATCIISKGYNNGGSSCVALSNTVERQLELKY